MNREDTLELALGEFVSGKAIEIISVPFGFSFNDAVSENNIEDEHRKAFIQLLTEVHQSYGNYSKNNPNVEVSVEALWITEDVKNQPFSAKIRMFYIVRAIDNSGERSYAIVNRVTNSIKSILNSRKYRFKDIEISDLKSILKNVDTSSVRTIVKNERVDQLQNQMLPYAYGFDVFDAHTKDFFGIIDVLINHPNCAVSFQLTATALSYGEESTISQYTQALNSLSKGISAPGVGNMTFVSAESLAAKYKYYQENRNGALFEFSLLIYGLKDAAEDIAYAYSGYANHDNGSPMFLKNIQLDPKSFDIKDRLLVLPWVVKRYLLRYDRNNVIWSQNTFNDLYRMPFVITAEEASLYFRLPLGSSRISAGLPIDESGVSSKTYADNVINSGDIEIGKLRSSSKGDTIGITLADLAKHMLVVGTPGSGKTTFSVGLLDRLWKNHHIPFLVIEPAKNEYRALVQSIPDVQIFTPGKNHISPFVYNPFVPPKNVRLETYKSTLKTAFAAGVSMTTPLDKIFEESINNCYSDFRWLDTYTSEDKGQIFNIADFIKCFQQTFDEIGYTGDAKNIGRAGVVRLNSLANLFDNYHSVPIEDLLRKPTIIELAAIENSDQKALIIALLLLSILAYVNANYIGEGGLKNVILLEEAHVLLDPSSNVGQGDANPSAIAQGLVKRMLAEIRSYGVGLIIADQSPRKVTTDVVALTDMKMAFRLVESVDKQIIGDSTNMSDTQIQRLAKLKPGEAFLFYNKLDEPEEVITPDYRLENNISITLSDEGIRKLTTYWHGKELFLRPYPQCKYCKHCQMGCDYSRRILAREVARRIFVKHFKSGDKDFHSVLEVFKRISSFVVSELNDELFTEELLSCVKLHLWRRIRYGTRIPVKEVQIINSLKK